MPTLFRVAPVGTNPMDQPELYKKNRSEKIRLILAIAGCIVLATALCGIPVYFITRPTVMAVAKIDPTQLPSVVAWTTTATATPTSTQTGTPAAATMAPSKTIPASATRTPWMVTQVVTQLVERIVEKHYTSPGKNVEVTRMVEITRIVYIEVPAPTATLAATQTPWVVTVVVTATPTETPTETPTPTQPAEPAIETPTSAPTETSTETPIAYP